MSAIWANTEKPLIQNSNIFALKKKKKETYGNIELNIQSPLNGWCIYPKQQTRLRWICLKTLSLASVPGGPIFDIRDQ